MGRRFLLAIAVAALGACAAFGSTPGNEQLARGLEDGGTEPSDATPIPVPPGAEAGGDAEGGMDAGCPIPKSACGGKPEPLGFNGLAVKTNKMTLESDVGPCPGTMRVSCTPGTTGTSFAFVEQKLSEFPGHVRFHQAVTGLRPFDPLKTGVPFLTFGCGLYNGVEPQAFSARLELSDDGKLEIDAVNKLDTVSPHFPHDPTGVEIGEAPNGERHTFDLEISLLPSNGTAEPTQRLRLLASVDGAEPKSIDVRVDYAIAGATVRCGITQIRPNPASDCSFTFSESTSEMCSP